MEINIQEITNQKLDQCISEIAHENKKALADLYEMTHQKVYGWILSILKNRFDAEDVLHDTYVVIYQSSKNYHSSGRPLSWILGIAKNLCLLKLRERKKEVSIPYEDYEEDLHVQKNLSVEDKLVLQQFMQCLSEEEREIVYLHTIVGFKHREIAQLMQLGLATVLSKYHRALKKLKKEFEKGEVR